MSQKTLTSFFNSRKRPACDDLIHSKNKVPHIERKLDITVDLISQECQSITRDHTAQQSPLPEEVYRCPSVPESNQPKSIDSAVFAKKVNTPNTPEPSKPKSVETARNELSLGDIRKKLASSSRLAELRATADRLSKGIKQLKEVNEKKNLKEFKSINVEVPVSPIKKIRNEILSPSKLASSPASIERLLLSPRKVIVSPVKSPSKVPAYIRHASLATSTTSLPLPHQYRFLAEVFRGMETVVSLLYNRNEKITFTKLKPSVQEMLKRNFTEKHLAQIKNLVPDFYNFEILKGKTFATSQKQSFELVITPNFPNDIKIMNPSVLLERRRYFYDTLLQLVKKHHAQYLLALDPPMVIPDDKLIRWHPEYELEKTPEVECAKLPEMPSSEKYSSAQDVLSKARELFKCNTKMERALEKLAHAKARGLTDQEKSVTGISDTNNVQKNTNSTQSVQATSSITIINPALRNLPASLLEKVKAKQAAKALEAMTRSSDYDVKYLIYSRLPDLSKTLRNIFVTERKNVLALNIILSKLDSSFKANISANDLQKDIKILTEEVPNFVKLHEIRGTSYLKLDKNVDLKSITNKLEAIAKKYKGD